MEQGGTAAESQPQNKLAALNDLTEEVMNTMKKTIGHTMKRGEKMDDLLRKTEEMERNGHQFKETTQKVSRFYQCRNVKLIVVMVVIVLVIVLIIVLLATGVIPTSAPLPPVVNPTKKPI